MRMWTEFEDDVGSVLLSNAWSFEIKWEKISYQVSAVIVFQSTKFESA